MQRTTTSFVEPFITNFQNNFFYLNQIFSLDKKNYAHSIAYLNEMQLKFYKICEEFSANPDDGPAFLQALNNFENKFYIRLVDFYKNINSIDVKNENNEQIKQKKRKKRIRTKAIIPPLEIPVHILRVKDKPSVNEFKKPGLITLAFTDLNQITAYWVELNEVKSKILAQDKLILAIENLLYIKVNEERSKNLTSEELYHPRQITLVFDEYYREEITSTGSRIFFPVADIQAHWLQGEKKQSRGIHFDEGKIYQKNTLANKDNINDLKNNQINELVGMIKREILSVSPQFKEAQKLLSDEKLFMEASYNHLLTTMVKTACGPERQIEFEKDISIDANQPRFHEKEIAKQNTDKFKKIMEELIPNINLKIELQDHFNKINNFNYSINEKLVSALSQHARENGLTGPKKIELLEKIVENKRLVNHKSRLQNKEVKKKIDSLKEKLSSIINIANSGPFFENLKSIETHYIHLVSLSDKIIHDIQTDTDTFVDTINKKVAIKHRFSRIVYLHADKLPSSLNKESLYFTSRKVFGMQEYEIFYVNPLTYQSESKQLSLFQSSIVDNIFSKEGAFSPDETHQLAALAGLSPEYFYYHLSVAAINTEIATLNSEIIKYENEIKAKSETLKKLHEKALVRLNKLRKIIANIKENNHDPNDIDIIALTNEANDVEKENNEILASLIEDTFILKNPDEEQTIQTQLKKLNTAITNFANKNSTFILRKNREITFRKFMRQKFDEINEAIRVNGEEIAALEKIIEEYNSLVNEFGSDYKIFKEKFKERIAALFGINIVDLTTKLDKIKLLNKDLLEFANTKIIDGQLQTKDPTDLQKFKTTFQEKVTAITQLINELNKTCLDTKTNYIDKNKLFKKQKKNLINHKEYTLKFEALKIELAKAEAQFNEFTQEDFLKKTEYLEFFKKSHNKDLQEEIATLTLILKNGKINVKDAVKKTSKASEHPGLYIITKNDVTSIENNIEELKNANTTLTQFITLHQKAYQGLKEQIDTLKKAVTDEMISALKAFYGLLRPSLTLQKDYNDGSPTQVDTNNAHSFLLDHYDAIQSGTIFQLIEQQPYPSLYINNIKRKFFEELETKKQSVIKDNEFIINNWNLPSRLETIDIDEIVKKLISAEDEYELNHQMLIPYALSLNETPFGDPLLSREVLIERAKFIKNKHLSDIKKDAFMSDGKPNLNKINEIEEFIDFFNALNEHLNNIQRIAKCNLKSAFAINYSHILDKPFRHEIMTVYLNARYKKKEININELLKMKEVIKIKNNYVTIQKTINALMKLLNDKTLTLADQKHLGRIHSSLVNLKQDLSRHVPCEKSVLHLEQGILNIYWELKANHEKPKPTLLINKLKYLIGSDHSNALHLLEKYGHSLLSKPKNGVPNIAEIKHIQHKGFQDALKKLRFFDHEENPILAFFKQCMGTEKVAHVAQKHNDIETYLKQAHLNFGDIDLLDINKLTSKDKARMRIIIKSIIEKEENLFRKPTKLVKDLEILLNPIQLKKDEEKFPFSCSLQRFMGIFGPNNPDTSQIDEDLWDLYIAPLKEALKNIYKDSIGHNKCMTQADESTRKEEQLKQEEVLLSRMINRINDCYCNLEIALKERRHLWPWYARFNIFMTAPPQNKALEMLKSFKKDIDKLAMRVNENKINYESHRENTSGLLDHAFKPTI